MPEPDKATGSWNPIPGIEAFREALARKESFAVVITDLGMPHVDGRKVAASVKAASPATPVDHVHDDEAPHVAAFCETLGERGYKTVGVGTGAAALD